MPATNATFSTFIDGGNAQSTDIVVGLRNGLNYRFTLSGIVGAFLPLAGGTMSGDINMAGNTITQVPSPSASSDVVPKSYVDALTAGEALTKVDDTNVTLALGGTPTTALLHATSLTLGWTGQLSLARGGTNANLTASNGGIFYSTATAGAILSGTATARQMLQSGASGAPAWSTTTWPATSTINRLLYSSSNNVVGEITTGNDGVLVTSAGGVPSISSTLPDNLVTNDPTLTQGIATKHYVDQNSLNGTSVYAASAASLGTVTQSGAGVGATLTNAGVQATFALDGVNPPAGSNVLIKNTAVGMTAANEGIYTVTDVGSGASNWILTRAIGYDTTTEINNTGLIVIQNGSTLAGTAWYNASTIVTVDTTAFSYSQFGNIIFPLTLAQGGTGASLVASNGGIFYSTGTTGAILAGTATAGQILQSGASAAPSWSTATYPSVATSTGSFIYANGTNFVASTSLWPNTVGTAGKIIRSDGTTNAYTTSTFADTYSASSLLYSNGANTVQGLATANSATLQTDSSGVPSWVTGTPIKTIATQTITTTGAGTYTPTSGTKFAIIELQGAGGGSGGTTGTAGQSAMSGGGGAGGYLKIIATAAQIGASATIAVGAAGTAGASGVNSGGNGGDTEITLSGGTTWEAVGGTGGTGQASSAAAQNNATNGGPGANVVGTNATLIINLQGGACGIGSTVATAGIVGRVWTGQAASFLGNMNNNANGAALNYGQGAAGTWNGSGANAAGVAGGQGIIVITEFIS